MSLKKISAIASVFVSVLATVAVTRPALATIQATISAAGPGQENADLSALVNPTVETFNEIQPGYYNTTCSQASATTYNGTQTCTQGSLVTSIGTFNTAFIQSGTPGTYGAQYGGGTTPTATPGSTVTTGSYDSYFDVDHNTSGFSNDLSSTLTLNSPAAYFGLWWSAGDPYNTLTFYSQGQVVGSFSTATVEAYLNSITNNVSQSYYGNPNNGDDGGEPFAFLNFYAPAGQSFDKIVLGDNGGTGFESDNFTVAGSYTRIVGYNLQVPESSNVVGMLVVAGLCLLPFSKRVTR
jgi:hypothetical protein